MPSERLGLGGTIHHIGIAAKEIKGQAALYQRILGVEPPKEIVEDALHKVKVGFSRLSDNLLVEFIEPVGPDSPIRSMVERNRGGLYHVCYQVRHLEMALEHARKEGAVIVSSPLPAKALGGKRVAFIAMPDGSLVELLEE